MSSLTTTEQIILNQFVEHLNQVTNNEIIKVILYGSRARGDNRPDSDIDVLIVVKDKKNIDCDKIYDFIIDVELEYGIDISLNIYDNDRFNQLALLKTPFVMNVIKEGENLWTI